MLVSTTHCISTLEGRRKPTTNHMLDPRLFRNNLDETEAQLARRSVQFDRQAYLTLEQKRKDIQVLTQDLQSLRNTRSKAIGKAKASGEDAQALMDEVQGFFRAIEIE